jgi:hypothetical protein
MYTPQILQWKPFIKLLAGGLAALFHAMKTIDYRPAPSGAGNNLPTVLYPVNECLAVALFFIR